MKEIIDHHVKSDHTACAWVVCGDLNAQPDSPVIKALIAHGFEDAYQGHEQHTCNPNRRAKRIDDIFHTAALAARSATLAEIEDLTPLPSAAEPSDHLAMMATLASGSAACGGSEVRAWLTPHAQYLVLGASGAERQAAYRELGKFPCRPSDAGQTDQQTPGGRDDLMSLCASER